MSEGRQSSSPSPRYPVRYNPITGRAMPSYHPPTTRNACTSSDSVADSISGNVRKNTATLNDDADNDNPYQQRRKLSSRPSLSSSSPLLPAEPIEQGAVFNTEARAVMEASTPSRFSETVQDTAPTTLREALKVKRADDDDFEDMVAAEMEALRLEYGIAKGNQSVDNEEEYSNATATACTSTPPASSVQSTRRSDLQYRSIIPMRDENEERRYRRQKAQEYGAQLRMQMEQDAKAKNGSKISKDAMHMKEDIRQPRPDNDACTASMSYGEQLRLQMKQEQQRRQLRKELDQSSEFSGTSGGFIFGGRDDDSITSMQRKALEYKRQLDEQIDERRRRDAAHEACGTNQPSKGREEVSGYVDLQAGSRYQQALDYKLLLDEQIEEKHRLSVPPTAPPISDNKDDDTPSTRIRNASNAQESDQSKVRQKKKEYGMQLREQMRKAEMHRMSPEENAPNATSLPFFASSEDREVHEREKEREDAVRHQQMLRAQIEEQKKAREKRTAEERAESTYIPFGDLTRPKSYADNSALPPSATPNSDNSHKKAKASSSLTFEGTAASSHSSKTSVLLACETTFVAAPSSATRRKPRKHSTSTSTPVADKVNRKPCMQSPNMREKARGGEAFVVQFEGDNCKDGEEKSVCKRQTRERGAKRSASNFSVAPVSPAGANSDGPIRALDSVLDQGVIQSALQKVEQNIPNGVEHRSSTCIQKKSTQTTNELASENVNPRKEAIGRASHQKMTGESRQNKHDVTARHSFESDIDEDSIDDEAEERLMQALSRIRNIMDTSLSDH